MFELCLNSLSCKSGFAFPQVFEPFYSTFNLYFDKRHLPLVSELKQLPGKLFIPILSNKDSDVLFWHDIDVKGDDNSSSIEEQCRMISDTSTGQHKFILDVNSKGTWTILLYAKKPTSEKNWTMILKFVLTAS